MPGKMLPCPHCSKVMRSDNLKNHITRHGDVQHATSYQPQPGHKRPSSSSQLLPIHSVSPVKNPKIQNLVNEILNDSAIVEDNVRPIPSIRQKSTQEKSNISKAIRNPPVYPPQNLPKKLLPFVVDNENSVEINEDDPNLHVVNLTKKSQPRTKHGIISFSDDGDDVDEQSSGEDTENEGDSDPDEANNKIVVPDNDEGLRDQFHQLFVEFTRDKKHEHGQELTVLLDEMLERGTITPLGYNKLNSVIAIQEKSSDEGPEEEDEMTRAIKDTVDHVIQQDKEELSDLLMELRDEVGKEFLDALLDLELLAGKFRIDEFQEGGGGGALLPLIEERRLKLEASPVSFTKLFRVKMLLSDINNIRRRVQELFQRVDDAKDNEEDIWKLLALQGLISDEQFEKLSKFENTDIETIASVLKGVKTGQGIPFLPTSL